MDRPNSEKKQSARMNYVWVMAGGYLWYLSAKLLGGLGDAKNIFLNLGGAAVFLPVGGFLLWREWKAYRYGLEHKDDPETWSEESLAEELPQPDSEEMPDSNGEETP